MILKPPLIWLLWSLFRASFRTVLRRTFSVSGLYFVLIVAVLVGLYAVDSRHVTPFLKTLFDLFGPTLLLLLTLYGIRTGLSTNPFSYNAAETTFLLGGPFSRRDLLFHKVFQFNLMALFVSVVGAATVGRGAFWEAFVKLYLVLLYVQGVPVAVAVLSGGGNTRAVRLVRFLAEAAMFVVLTALGMTIYFAFVGNNFLLLVFQKTFFEMTSRFAFVDRFVRSPLVWENWRVFLHFIIPDAVFALIFLLGYRRLKVESIFYRNLNEQRRTRFEPWRWIGTVPSRWLPHWGGMGPLLWRKLQEYARHFRAVLIVSALTLLAFTGFTIFLLKLFDPAHDFGLKVWHLYCGIQIFALVLVAFSGFCDFRSDTSQLPVIKTWPVSATRVAFSQIFISSLNLSLLMGEMAVVGAFLYAAYTPFDVTPFLLQAFVAIPITAFVIASFDNLIFLLFPVAETRLTGRTVGRLLGQFILLMIGNALLGRLFFLIDEKASRLSQFAFFGVTSGVYLAGGILLFSAVVLAFKKFDISRV